VLAAAAIVALEHMVDRLADDHANAKRLAEGLAEIPGFDVNLASVQSNIVIFGWRHPTATCEQVVRGLAAEGVKWNAIGPQQFRAVTHYGIERQDIEAALAAARKVVKALS